MQSPPSSVCPSICLSVHPSISTLSFEPTDLWPWSFARVWVTTMARMDWNRRWQVRVKTWSVWPRSSIENSFLVIIIFYFAYRIAYFISGKIYKICRYAFSALMLLVGHQEKHEWCCCWHGCLSGASCKWFAYSPADATATPSSLVSLKSRMVNLPFWCWLTKNPRLSWKRCH